MPEKNLERIVVSLFFLVFLLLGFLTYKDYGVSTDENSQLRIGKVNYLRMRGVLTDSDLLNECENYAAICDHSPLFEMLLYRLV